MPKLIVETAIAFVESKITMEQKRFISERHYLIIPQLIMLRLNIPYEILGPWGFRRIECPFLSRKIFERAVRWMSLKRAPIGFDMENKVGFQEFVTRHGVKCPRVYVSSIHRSQVRGAFLEGGELFNLDSNSFVLKPVDGYQNINTYVVQDTWEILRQQQFDLKTACQNIENDRRFDTYMVEELLVDENGTLPPRDFKFFVVGDKIMHVMIMTGRTKMSEGLYRYSVSECNELYEVVDSWMTKGSDHLYITHSPQLPPKPACWNEMVSSVRTLGKAMNCFARIDFYATPRGAVFGEFQLTLDTADWNATMDAELRKVWKGADGCDNSKKGISLAVIEALSARWGNSCLDIIKKVSLRRPPSRALQ